MVGKLRLEEVEEKFQLCLILRHINRILFMRMLLRCWVLHSFIGLHLENI